MKNIAFISAMLLIVMGAAGCQTRHVYDGLRIQQELECQKLERSDQEHCFRRSGMSYDEYERHLKEREK